MNPVALFFGLALLTVSVFFVTSPFRSPDLQKKSVGRSRLKDSMKSSPQKQRQAVLLALRDLDFDYQAGKVAEEDYQALRASLVTDAAQLIEGQEQAKDDEIEVLIQARRKATAFKEGLCQHCQSPLQKGAKFCSKCGSPVTVIPCPKCGQAVSADDRFCPACGTTVNAGVPSLELKGA